MGRKFTGIKGMLRSRKGASAIVVSISMPVILGVLGLVIDMGILMYSREQLSSATKFAAISATAMYKMDGTDIDLLASRGAAKKVLTENYDNAIMLDGNSGYKTEQTDKKITCTIGAKADVPVFFIKIFGIKDNTIQSSYTATRKIKVKKDGK